MNALEVKSDSTTPSSTLSLPSIEKEPKVSFSELLKGVNPKSNAKVIQNGIIVLALEGEQEVVKNGAKPTNKETLLSLLKTDEKVSHKDSEPLAINSKITQNLTVQEVKTLVAGAKEYLKEKILQSDGFKESQIKELPKTLKGLATLAQKIGIDISKITIEEVQTKTAKPILKQVSQDVQSKSVKPAVAEVQTKTSKPILKQVSEDVQSKSVKPAVAEVQTKITKPILKQAVEEVQTKSVKPVAEEVQVKTVQKEEVKSQLQGDVKELKSTPKEQTAVKEVQKKATIKVDDKNQATQVVETKKTETQKQTVLTKETPLFKAQTQSEHTTEQLVATKQFKVEEKTPKSRADDTLKLLLRGEKPSHTNSIMTADFSVATAKVIAPTATSEATKSLESLLRGESNENSSASKTDGLQTLKSDSFEVKLNEAKQMIKYLSSDVKTAIEDYKSPFTRVKVQLNPQKLGEVDVTIVQRGKNLHINISSNSTAINTLSVNANELRAQLNSNGINNASLNFNSQDSSQSSAGQQEQHRQKEQQAREEYGILRQFENEEHAEEILSSLEIVVPNYA